MLAAMVARSKEMRQAGERDQSWPEPRPRVLEQSRPGPRSRDSERSREWQRLRPDEGSRPRSGRESERDEPSLSRQREGPDGAGWGGSIQA